MRKKIASLTHVNVVQLRSIEDTEPLKPGSPNGQTAVITTIQAAYQGCAFQWQQKNSVLFLKEIGRAHV